MANVFVVQENPNLNYLPAEEFGEITFLTKDEFSPVRQSLRNEQIVKDIASKMAEFNPDTDFLLLSGNPITIAYAFHKAVSIKGYVNVLWYLRNEHRYVTMPMTGE